MFEMETAERIVVLGIDGSEHAERAFQWYVEHSHRPGQKLLLVHVVEPVTIIGEVPSVEMYERAVDESRGKAKKLEDKFAKLMKEKAVTGKITVMFGSSPGEVIVKAAEENQAIMIIMGTRGQGALRRTIMGSVSDYVVHHAHCPVIVCRH